MISIWTETMREQVIGSIQVDLIRLQTSVAIASWCYLFVTKIYMQLNRNYCFVFLLSCALVKLLLVYNKVNEFINNVNSKWNDCIAESVDGTLAVLGHVTGNLALGEKIIQNYDSSRSIACETFVTFIRSRLLLVFAWIFDF